jgi:16S rRNA (cytosine1402-N4)-methyltransferase
MSTYHNPVMVEEVLEGLNINPNGIYVDLTFGGGGHSKKILDKLNKGHLYAFDQDNDAENKAGEINDTRFTFIKANAKYLKNFMLYYNVDKVNGIFADLGVSSHQIDTQERGFSTRFCADLDMRMNVNKKTTAKNILNNYPEKDLEKVFLEYGELYNYKQIVHLICEYRKRKRINTTFDLKNLLLENIKIPKRYEIKFLSQVFQALRIEINDELNTLKVMLKAAYETLVKNGRLVVLSYHSLEDRIVKNFFKSKTLGDNNSTTRRFKILTHKPLQPSFEEIERNSRSRSAKLRIAELVF